MQNIEKPNQIILTETALVPSKNIVKPAPNHFTHQLIRQEDFYFEQPKQGLLSNGFLKEGTKVLLTYNSEKYSRVITDQGLYITVASNSLKAI